jgi:hypothetical protein
MALIETLQTWNARLQEKIYTWRTGGTGERVSPCCQDEISPTI